MNSTGQGASAPRSSQRLDDRGYIMVALLVAMGVTAIWMSAALPAWRQQSMREKELDLIFRGEQYARAIALYQIKNNASPINIDVLVTQRYLRKKWKDPITGEDFQIIGLAAPGQSGGSSSPPASSTVPPIRGGGSGAPARGGPVTQGPGTAPGRGQAPAGGNPGLTGGITGVRSTSQATSIRIYNGQQQHNLWQFDAALMMSRMGRNQGGGAPGQGRGDGRGGFPGGRPGGPPGGARPGGPPGPGRGPGGLGPGGRGGIPPGGPGRGAGT